MSLTQPEIALKIAESHLGLAYMWGGNNARTGFDCSGFVVEVLRSVGVLPIVGDWTAAMLLERFAHNKTAGLTRGNLVFWGDPATHVELIYEHSLASPTLTIGASASAGFIQIRPMKPSPSAIVNPF